MLLREIKKINIIEILILPLIFIAIFIAGMIIFIQFNLNNYLLYTGWCFISGVIVIGIIGIYTYLILKEDSYDKYQSRQPPQKHPYYTYHYTKPGFKSNLDKKDKRKEPKKNRMKTKQNHESYEESSKRKKMKK